MGRPDRQDDTKTKSQGHIPGDPGVGGLLSDPQKPAGPHEEPDPSAGPPSPDPAPPRQHGDWMPPRRSAVRMTPSARLVSLARRKSWGGMPRALFREHDGSTLDDLRALAAERRV